MVNCMVYEFSLLFFWFSPIFSLFFFCDCHKISLFQEHETAGRERGSTFFLRTPSTVRYLTPCPVASGNSRLQSGILHSLSLLQFCNQWCSWDYKPPVELASMQEEEHGSEPKDPRLPYVNKKCAGKKNSGGVRNRAPRSLKMPLGGNESGISHKFPISFFRLKLIISTFLPFSLNLREDAGSYVTPCHCSPMSAKELSQDSLLRSSSSVAIYITL